jgi:NAD(P)H-dependent flavin oxidoreductase YrpB (nitropropane dioxygenase family)
MTLPLIIQGGMGVAVSGWRLARAVSAAGQLGVVSGTLLPVVLARRLQLGDPDGELRAALAAFPDPSLSQRVRERFFIPGGKAPDAPFAAVPMPSAAPSRAWTELTLAANFVEVWLAKQTHAGRVGLNLLEKIQTATLASLYGAMLAGVDVVLMGAGIPRAIPGVLDRFAAGQPAELPLDVTDAPPSAPLRQTFNPADYLATPPVTLRRPAFLAIVSSAALATTLARKASGRVDGFVIENNAAGGHNAPPRGGRAPGPDGQPVYGPRDEPELEKFRALGLPFWLAGERATPARLAEARALGASGVQIGTAFAFCAESGLDPALKTQACTLSRSGAVKIFTDPAASPTGFPFKVLDLPGTLSEPDTYAAHPRRCDLGYLRETFVRPDGELGYRCPAEPAADYAAKNGNPADTCGRKCLCNGLLAAIGLGQIRRPETPADAPYLEPAIVTAGQETADIARFLAPEATGYTARQVLDHILTPQTPG